MAHMEAQGKSEDPKKLLYTGAYISFNKEQEVSEKDKIKKKEFRLQGVNCEKVKSVGETNEGKSVIY